MEKNQNQKNTRNLSLTFQTDGGETLTLRQEGDQILFNHTWFSPNKDEFIPYTEARAKYPQLPQAELTILKCFQETVYLVDTISKDKNRTTENMEMHAEENLGKK